MEALVRTRRSSLAGVNLDLRPVITSPRIPTHHHVDEGDYRVAGREGKGSSFKRKGSRVEDNADAEAGRRLEGKDNTVFSQVVR